MDFHVPVLLRIPQGFSSLFCEIKKGGAVGKWEKVSVILQNLSDEKFLIDTELVLFQVPVPS